MQYKRSKRETAAIGTLGCKVNQYESACIEESLQEAGYNIVPFEEKADIYILNTCTVTHRVDYQCRQLIRRAHLMNPEALIVVTGCYAQTSPEMISGLPGVSLILGNALKNDLIKFLKETRATFPQIIVTPMEIVEKFKDPALKTFMHRTRAFLKIQDGCNASCTYCIVPMARGRSRSLPVKEVLQRLEMLLNAGHEEIVLTGIHLGSYGSDLLPTTDLLSLLKGIEEKTRVPRLRLSSLEPHEISHELIEYIASSSSICHHLHIPLQSGDDEILKRMNRPYTTQDFQELILEIVSHIPSICIGIDVIVGFPGEEEKNFERTFRFIESLPISYLHVFPFSRRKGTQAATFSQQIDPRIIKQRAKILRELGIRKKEAYCRRFIGKRLLLLMEEKKDSSGHYYMGHSRNYLAVFLENIKKVMKGEIEAEIVRIEGEKIYGQPLNLAQTEKLC